MDFFTPSNQETDQAYTAVSSAMGYQNLSTLFALFHTSAVATSEATETIKINNISAKIYNRHCLKHTRFPR